MLKIRHLEKLADVLLWGLFGAREEAGGEFKKGGIVMVYFQLPALRLAEILQKKILERSMNPVMRLAPTAAMEQNLFSRPSEDQIAFPEPGMAELCRDLNGRISLFAPESLYHLSGVSPEKFAWKGKSEYAWRKVITEREEEGLCSWTLTVLPTEALASESSLFLEDYEREFVRTCFLDRSDPVRVWGDAFREIGEIKKWLTGLEINRIHLQSAGTDLWVTVGEKRKWCGGSGRNIPSFEVFTSPDWRGTEGYYFANLPSYHEGALVESLRIEFLRGRVMRVKTLLGEKSVSKMLEIDTGARQVGEFSLTDKRLSRIKKFMAHTLFDENYGGTYGNSHIALGSSYSNAYDGARDELTPEAKKALGFNDSALHWDLVNTEDKTATAYLTNGKNIVIYEDGKFAY